MSIFNNITKPINNEEVKLFVKMKYSKFNGNSIEYLEQLPEAVITAAAKKIFPGRTVFPHNVKESLELSLRSPSLQYVEEIVKAIEKSLIEYHTLL